MLSRREEFVRGWPVLIASAVGSGVGVAPLAFYSLGAFIHPLSTEFGWTRGEVTGASLALSFGMLVMGSCIGAIADRFTARRVVLISMPVLSLLFAALSHVTSNIWSLYIGYFVLGAFGAGTLPITWSRVVTGWFVKARGLALGLSLVGTGLVGMLLPTYVTWLIGMHGWRSAYLGIALLPVALGLPLAFLYFQEPPFDPNATGIQARKRVPVITPLVDVAGYTFTEAAGQWRFWQMASAFFLAAIVLGGINVNALPMLTDRGIDVSTAAAITGLVGATVTVGRLISGHLLDLFPGSRVAFFMLAAPAGACVMLAYSGVNLPLSALAIILIGFAAGAEHDIAAYFASRYFGRRRYGAIYGLLYTLYTFGSGIGPLLAGMVFDVTGSYQTALFGGAVIFLTAAILVGLLGEYPKEGELEELRKKRQKFE